MVFRKGQSGNPGGQRGRRLLIDALHCQLSSPWIDSMPPALPHDAKGAQILVHKLLMGAMESSDPLVMLKYIREIFDRAYGKPNNFIEVDEITPPPKPSLNFDALTLEELETYRDLHLKLTTSVTITQ